MRIEEGSAMRLLFDDRLAPITSEIGFIEAPAAVAAATFVEWQRRIHEPLGRSLTERPISAPLEDVLLSLVPLTSVHALRFLFVPTQSRWTAFFDSGYRGTDAFSTISWLAGKLGCHGLRIVAVPDTIEGEFKGARGRYGGLSLCVYGPDRTHFLNYVRTIGLIHDGDRWSFDQTGTPFPFENLAAYGARRKRDRFTFEMLEHYLAELGLEPFNEDFYRTAPDEPARLIERHGQRPPGLRELTLEEVRAEFE
jgi:hypothetical protein